MRRNWNSLFDQPYKLEADLLADAQEYLASKSAIECLPIRINDDTHRGYSDLFILVDGRICFAELKRTTGTPSKHQEKFLEQVQQYNGTGAVIKTLAELQHLVDITAYCQCSNSISRPGPYCNRCGKTILGWLGGE